MFLDLTADLQTEVGEDVRVGFTRLNAGSFIIFFPYCSFFDLENQAATDSLGEEDETIRQNVSIPLVNGLGL